MMELIRVARAAQILDVTRKRIYILIDEGKLEAVKLGPRQTRIVRQSLDAYIARLRKRRRIECGMEEDSEQQAG